MYSPKLDDFLKLASQGNLIPVTRRLLADSDKKVTPMYGSMGNYMGMTIAKRNTFLIDPSGKITKVWVGVDPSHHSDEVLAELGTVAKS